MRITVVILSVLLAQGSASFFSELSKSFTAVRASVEKLISDAATDIKHTIDCTVFSVHKAFITEGAVSDTYDKCQKKQPENVIPIPPPIEISIAPINVIKQLLPPERINTKSRENKEKTKENTKDSSKLERDVQHYGRSLDGETLFTNMSSTFEVALSKLADNHFDKIEHENKPSLKIAIKEIDKLEVEEDIHQNKTDAKIREIFNQLTKSQINNTDKLDLRNEIRLVLAELEQSKNKTNSVESDLEHWKEKESKYLDEIKDIVKENKLTTKVSPKETEQNTERLANIAANNAHNLISTTPLTGIAAAETTPTVITTTKSETTLAHSMDYQSLVSQDKDTLEGAEKLIDESRKQAASCMLSLETLTKLQLIFLMTLYYSVGNLLTGLWTA